MANYIVFTKRDGFDFYSTETKLNYTFAFSTTAIQDLEVIDEEKVISEIENFLQVNKIRPGTCDIILSDAVVFTSDFIDEAPKTPRNITSREQALRETQLQTTVGEYLKAVPFENVTSKTARIGNGIRIVAANTDFYTVIVEGCKRQQIIVNTVVPVALISGTLQNASSLTMGIVQMVEKTPELLRQNNFLFMAKAEKEKTGDEPVHTENTGKETVSKSRTYILVGVFSILLLVLAIMVYKNVIAPQKPKTPLSAITTPAPAAPETVVQPTIQATSSASIAPETIEIDMKSTAVSTASGVIRKQLITAGFTNIINEQIPNPASGILAVFDTSISTATQNQIINTIHTTYPSLHTVQSNVGVNKVVITVGNE